MSKLSNELSDFIIEQIGEINFVITDSTTLQNDLLLWGDDAVDFLELYGKKFKVDLSEFEIGKYFKPEGDVILLSIIQFFARKKKPSYLVITLGDLEEGIKKGKLC